ncbi:hypothetical protein V2J09_009754 [Rumex salicifolius]
MFNKIIKRAHRKSSKGGDDGYGFQQPGNHGGAVVSASNVVVNHASRVGPLDPSSLPHSGGAVVSTMPPPPPGGIESLPMFKDVANHDRQALFLRKLQICSYMFDFTDTLKSVREKEIKRQTLLELIEFIQSGSGKIPDNVQDEMIKMVSINIFRCLPPSSHENTGMEATDPDDEEPYFEPSWTHLQLVYELLLRYVVAPGTDTKVAKRCIDHSFVLKLLDLFDSEDPREREYLKTILHRIYGKFMVHRPFIRKAINNIFYRFIYEKERHNGIVELLEILGSIINGFALPMKEEHKLFLVRALIPLHKPKMFGVYQMQLSYCITQFVEKDFRLADTVIRGLLKYWPVTNCQKEVLFLAELEEVLEVTQATEFQRCINPLFRQIARCLRSSHFQVAERALFLWNNEAIVSLIAQHRVMVLPIIFDALEKNIQSHWNQAIHGLTVNVRKMFQDMDTELFEECQKQYEENVTRSTELEEQRAMAWKKLAEVAAENMTAA